MVIQRIQTLLLLLALICNVVFLFTPFAYGPEGVTPLAFPAVWITLAAASLLTLVDIFLFKNTSLQKTVLLISCAAVVAALVLCVIRIFSDDLTIGGGGLIMIASVCLYIGAYRSIRADEKLLRSLDRLR